MKRLLSGGLAFFMALAFLIFPVKAAADTCIEPVVCVPIPGPTITVAVPGPTVTVPGPVQTIIKPQPQKTVVVNRRVTEVVPGPTKTVTTRQTVTARATITPPAVTTTVTAAPTPAPTVTVTVTKAPEARKVIVTKTQAVGISLGFVAFGILLGLLAIYIAYVVGWKNAEQNETNRLKRLAGEIFGRR